MADGVTMSTVGNVSTNGISPQVRSELTARRRELAEKIENFRADDRNLKEGRFPLCFRQDTPEEKRACYSHCHEQLNREQDKINEQIDAYHEALKQYDITDREICEGGTDSRQEASAAPKTKSTVPKQSVFTVGK